MVTGKRLGGSPAAIAWITLSLLCAAISAEDPAEAGETPLGAAAEWAREIVASRRASLDELVANGAATDRELAAAHGEMGRIYLVVGLQSAAAGEFDRAAELRPEDPRWPYYLAVLDERKGRFAEASRRLQRVLELLPNDESARLRRGRVQALARGEAPPVPAFADPLVDGLEALAARLKVDYAVELMLEGELPRAISWLEELVAADPADWRAHYRLGVARFRAGEVEPAIASVRLALELAPDFGEGHFSLASALDSHGRPEEALRHFELAYEADPGSSAVQLRWAQELGENGRAAEALPILEGLVAREPNDVRAVALLAEILTDRGRPLEAAERLRASADRVEAAEGRAVLLLQAGQLAAGAGRVSEGIADLRRAAALAPDRTETHTVLASALARSGRFAEAAAAFGEVVRLQPTNAEPRFSRALALLLARLDAEARTVLEEAVADFPNERSLSHLLARLLATSEDDAVRDGARALALARGVLEAESSLEHAETVAMALAEVGDFTQAVSWQERIVSSLGGSDAQRAAAAFARLERYRRGEPVRAPWSSGGSSPAGSGR